MRGRHTCFVNVAIVLIATSSCDVEPRPRGDAPYCDAALEPPARLHPQAENWQAALDHVVDAGIPGVVMAVRDGDGFWTGAAGYADLGREIPMETCHTTRIGSITKTFVATTVLVLSDAGAIDLDLPITHYLPDERRLPPHADRITTRHLLNHTSGVRNYLDVRFVTEILNRPHRTWTLDQCYEAALEGDPDFAPGEDWSYSNTNYLLAARIIEAVTGRPHAQIIEEALSSPLGLDSTTYHPDSFNFPGVVRGYLDLNGDGALIDSTDTYANYCSGPDGTMVSSAGDLVDFLDAVFADRSVLSAEALTAMWPTIATEEAEFPAYGLGVESWVGGTSTGVGHGGHEFGYRTFAYHFPALDVTFVIWFNASSLTPTDDNIARTITAERDRMRDLVLATSNDSGSP